MRLKICFILLILLAIFKNGYAMESTEDDQNIYTTLNWNEIADDVQRDIMLFFSNKISNKLQAELTGLDIFLNSGVNKQSSSSLALKISLIPRLHK